MRAVVQRVSRAKVTVDGEVTGEIGTGLLVLLGVADKDTEADADYLLDKIVNLRIFEDDDGKMNLSLIDIEARCSSFRSSRFTATRDAAGGRHLSRPPGRKRRTSFTSILSQQAKARVDKVATGRLSGNDGCRACERRPGDNNSRQ